MAKSNKNITSQKLDLLVTIVNRNKAEFYLDLIQSFDVNMQVVAYAEGTAKQEILALLNLTDSNRAVIFSVIREDKSKVILESLDNRFKTIKNGKGIACAIPMSSVIGVSIFSFLSNNRNLLKEDSNGSN